LYQTFRPGSESKLEWIEGVAILTAVAIATIAQSVNDYQKERQFRKLNKKVRLSKVSLMDQNEDRHLKVVRGGQPQLINIHEILVGDILMMEPGEVVPVDGIFAEGFNVSCDESTLTGETKSIHKMPAPIALEGYSPQGQSRKRDCFIFSGSKVVEGVGKTVVTAVGEHSCYGQMLLCIQSSRSLLIPAFKDHQEEETPLQLRLDRIADLIAKWGTSMAFLLFIILVTKFLIALPNNPLSASEKMAQFMQIVIVAVSIVVVAVPEGLPLAVTLALAYATVRMIKDNNLVRVLKACETMGNATTICSDKTGTLTENKMIVVAGSLGRGNNFARSSVDTGDQLLDMPDMTQFFSDLSPETASLLQQSIALNSTAFETTDETGKKSFVGSTTETALLSMAKEFLGLDDVGSERANANVVQQLPFSSERKFMGTVIKLDKGYRLLVKGAPEMILARSTKLFQPAHGDHFHPSSSTTADRSIVASSTRRNSQVPDRLYATEMSINDRNDIVHLCTTFASDALRLLGFAYRDFATWPPKGIGSTDNILLDNLEGFFNELNFCGVIAMKDPLRHGVVEAVLKCRKAGVSVRMVTGDNILTAKAVARECGILTPGGIVLDGAKFRSMADGELDVVVPRLQVLARSTPDDKRRLVERLKSLGEVVAVTGDGTNDGPALITADVGFSMGISGTEVAKEASSIILMDDNFSSIVNAIAWGRCVNDAVKKFLQVSSALYFSNLVSIDRKRHGRGNDIRDGHCEFGTDPGRHSRAIVVGQSHSGHARCAGPRHRPPHSRSPRPRSRT
jgi:P-type Ca2+ transporter type 2C